MSCFTRSRRFGLRAPLRLRRPWATSPSGGEGGGGGQYPPSPGTPGANSTSSTATRPAESFRDSQARFDLLTKLTRLLERRHTQMRGCFQYLASLGFFPTSFARLESLPTPLLEELHRALEADRFAVELLIRTTVVAAETQATTATQAAQETLRHPDSALLSLLKQGKITLDLAWYEVLYGILPFASLFLEAAARHHHGGPSLIVTRFMRVLPGLQFRCPATGKPSLGRSFIVVQQFVADCTAFGISFNVRDVLLALGTAITRVGYGKGTDWDKFYM